MNGATERILLGAAGLVLCLAASSCTTTGISGNAERLAGNAEPMAVLIDGLKSEDPVIRADAARLLGDLRAREAIDPLVKYVTTDRGHSKTAGLDALARIGDPTVCPRIRSLVNQPMVPEDAPWYGHSAVRLSAAIALLSLGDQSGLPFLREIVNRKDDDSDPDAGMWALYTWFAPTVLALPDTLPPAPELKRGITFDRLFPKEKRDPGQIVVIARALGMLGTEQAQAKLVELLSFPSRYVRASAAASLLKASPTREHLDSVAKLEASDPTEFVRIKAALALSLAGEDRYIPVIVKAARQAEDSFDRAAAVESLGLLGRSECMPLLLSQLRHEDAFVRLSAIEAIDRLGGGEIAAGEIAQCRLDENPRVRLYAAKFFAARKPEKKQASEEALALKVGVGVAEITPPQPQLLTAVGMTHAQPTRGVLDPLQARALAFQAGGKLAFVVTGDQLFVGSDLQGAVAQAVAKEIGYEAPSVMVTCTHNHSSSPTPAANSGDAGRKAQADARSKVTDGFVQACVSAYRNLRPAEIAATALWLKEPVGINRRMVFADGKCLPNWGDAVAVPGDKLWGSGPSSRRVDLLSVREPGQTRPFAILTTYSSHIHMLGLPYFGGEFAGAARRAIEARVPGATAVYANCTAGDINLTQVLPVSLEDANSAEALQYVRDSLAILSKRFADAVVPSIPTDGYIRPTSFRQPTEYGTGRGVQVSALLLDNIALGVVPGEMFSEFGDLMHRSSPLGHLVLLGYGGGGGGYVFPPVGYEQGGYELRNMPSPGTRGLDISNKLTEVLEQMVRSQVTQHDSKPGLAAKQE